MGFEYSLDFEVGDPAQIDLRLRAVPGFERFDSRLQLYSFRRSSTGEMPDAFAKLEDRGVYLCDNGNGRAVLEEIRAALRELSGPVELREL